MLPKVKIMIRADMTETLLNGTLNHKHTNVVVVGFFTCQKYKVRKNIFARFILYKMVIEIHTKFQP